MEFHRSLRSFQLNFSLSKDASFLGSVFEPTSVERGHTLRASLILDLNYGGEDPNNLYGHQQHQAQQQQQFTGHRSFWVIDLAGQVTQFPGLFRLKVYPEDSAGGGSGSSEEFLEHEKLPEGDPLLDYEVGVFEEKKFQARSNAA